MCGLSHTPKELRHFVAMGSSSGIIGETLQALRLYYGTQYIHTYC